MFFSTTDKKGIIETVNSMFVRLSAYPEAELVGHAHNILRNPDMPAGLFYLMWQRLKAEQPMVAYVKNLAKDGYFYWTLATITALPEAPARLIARNRQVKADLGILIGRLDDYSRLTDEFAQAQQTSDVLNGAITQAANASAVVSQASPVLGKAGKAAVALSRDMVDAMQRLTLSLEIARELTMDLRMQITIAALQIDMISSFIVESATGGSSVHTDQQIEMLTSELRRAVESVDATLSATNSGLIGIREDIATLDESFTEFHRMLMTWRQLVVRFQLSGELRDMLPPIDAQLNEGRTRMNSLNALGELASALAEPIDTTTLRASVGALVGELTHVAG
ncbi:hypothetical protein [Rarobacter incanus]|uniref:PAS domain S-box-containing protein n=1 Tax=Rarobacter incanus TaxID=153494 RepID=A0A542SR80_9MICO|nr:hypothetical protein [Rarobacter incanus]TQK77104.1 PAS domain S-box-containing protein [Rarobacter incanus]